MTKISFEVFSDDIKANPSLLPSWLNGFNDLGARAFYFEGRNRDQWVALAEENLLRISGSRIGWSDIELKNPNYFCLAEDLLRLMSLDEIKNNTHVRFSGIGLHVEECAWLIGVCNSSARVARKPVKKAKVEFRGLEMNNDYVPGGEPKLGYAKMPDENRAAGHMATISQNVNAELLGIKYNTKMADPVTSEKIIAVRDSFGKWRIQRASTVYIATDRMHGGEPIFDATRSIGHDELVGSESEMLKVASLIENIDKCQAGSEIGLGRFSMQYDPKQHCAGWSFYFLLSDYPVPNVKRFSGWISHRQASVLAKDIRTKTSLLGSSNKLENIMNSLPAECDFDVNELRRLENALDDIKVRIEKHNNGNKNW